MALRPRLPQLPDLPSMGGNLVRAIFESQVQQPISDAYWAMTHPVDRIMGRGRAENGMMAYPLGGRYTPKTPGLRAESLQRGDPMVELVENASMTGLEGQVAKFRPGHPGHRAYNLKNEQGEIVASADRMNYPAGREQSGSAYIPQMWVREDYRKTPAMFDLYNILSRGGKVPLRATFANKKLEKVFNKRMERANKPKPEPKPKSPPLPNPSLSKPIPRADTQALAIALEMERRGLMNRPARSNPFADAPVLAAQRARPLPRAQNPTRRSSGRRGGV